MIQKLLANSSPTKKKIFGGVFIAVIIALFYFLLIEPAVKNLTRVENDITKEEKLIQGDLRVLAEKQRIEDDIARYQSYLNDAVTDEGVIISNFLKRVDELSGSSEVIVVNKLPPKKTETDQPYIVYQGDFEANGKFENVIKFIHSVETSKELFKVVKFNMTGKKGEAADDIKATLTIAQIIITTRPQVNDSQQAAAEIEPKP